MICQQPDDDLYMQFLENSWCRKQNHHGKYQKSACSDSIGQWLLLSQLKPIDLRNSRALHELGIDRGERLIEKRIDFWVHGPHPSHAGIPGYRRLAPGPVRRQTTYTDQC